MVHPHPEWNDEDEDTDAEHEVIDTNLIVCSCAHPSIGVHVNSIFLVRPGRTHKDWKIGRAHV